MRTPHADPLRIATRKSPLALHQANLVRDLLLRHHPGLRVELLPMSTQGDRILDAPLAKIGGKGLFIKELEQRLLSGEADLAVHSMKDVPAELPEHLLLACYCAAGDPRDVTVSNHFPTLSALPAGARVGTSALRRQSQLRAAFPGLEIIDLRGNVATRLAKLDAGEYDLILLAAAGLQRLDLTHRIGSYLEPDNFVPAVAQGVIGIECRSADLAVRELLRPLHHQDTAIRVDCERSFSARLGGGCQLPVAGHARLRGDQLELQGLVALPDGSQVLRGSATAPATQAVQLGAALAEQLLERGADRILHYVANH